MAVSALAITSSRTYSEVTRRFARACRSGAVWVEMAPRAAARASTILKVGFMTMLRGRLAAQARADGWLLPDYLRGRARIAIEERPRPGRGIFGVVTTSAFSRSARDDARLQPLLLPPEPALDRPRDGAPLAEP